MQIMLYEYYIILFLIIFILIPIILKSFFIMFFNIFKNIIIKIKLDKLIYKIIYKFKIYLIKEYAEIKTNYGRVLLEIECFFRKRIIINIIFEAIIIVTKKGRLFWTCSICYWLFVFFEIKGWIILFFNTPNYIGLFMEIFKLSFFLGIFFIVLLDRYIFFIYWQKGIKVPIETLKDIEENYMNWLSFVGSKLQWYIYIIIYSFIFFYISLYIIETEVIYTQYRDEFDGSKYHSEIDFNEDFKEVKITKSVKTPYIFIPYLGSFYFSTVESLSFMIFLWFILICIAIVYYRDYYNFLYPIIKKRLDYIKKLKN